jgi:Type II secretion system (T2SS), protein E, N-terminal domain
MARCAAESCGRWRPELLVRRGLGASVDGLWFCSKACVERMARRRLTTARPTASGIPTLPPIRLGALLRHHGVCGAEAIEQALKAQRGSRLKLGEQLCAMGAAERDSVLRVLAAQAGVGYLAAVDVASVRQAPGGLSPHAVRALGLVPISGVEDGRIRVACPAPVPRRALGALRRLTGWVPEPYLVADDDWQALVDNYGADVDDHSRGAGFTELVQTASVSDAAARIATAATRGGATTVTEARWEPYTWVRVQGAGLVEDVLLARAGATVSQEEVPCPVVTTSH